MKFSEELFNRAVPEWREKYVDYRALKQLILEMELKYPILEKTTEVHKETELSRRLLGGLEGNLLHNDLKEIGGNVKEVESRLGAIAAKEVATKELHAHVIEGSREEKKFQEKLQEEIRKINVFFKEKHLELEEARTLLNKQVVLLWRVHQEKDETEEEKKELKRLKSTYPMGPNRSGLKQRQVVPDTESTAKAQALRRNKSLLKTPPVAAAQKPNNFSFIEKLYLQKKTKKLRNAFLEYYRGLDLLSSYQALNYTAFRKILKKHDKKTGYHIQKDYMKRIQKEDFMVTKLDDEMKRVERVVTDVFFNEDRARAMNTLRVPSQTYRPFDHLTFQIGVFSALFFVGVVIGSIIAATSSSILEFPLHQTLLALMRPVIFPIIMFAFLGINAHIWRKYHVNYALIFSLNHRSVFDWRKMLVCSGYLLFLCVVCLSIYWFYDDLHVNPVKYVGNMPFSLLCFMAAFVILPHPIMYRQRKWLGRVIVRIFGAPFRDVFFEDFWLADQFNSLALVFTDIHFSICYFSTGQYSASEADANHTCTTSSTAIRPILAALPAWWRFAQCIRRFAQTKNVHHLKNAGKYFTSFLVILSSTGLSIHREHNGGDYHSTKGWLYYGLWITSLVLNTAATMYWDFFQDWSVFEKTKKGWQFRKNRLYPLWMYVFAICNNAIFRLTWSFTISVGFFDIFLKQGLITILGLGEMWRRFWWNFFRLENEHLNNCGEFRAVKKIPMPFERSVGDNDFQTNAKKPEHAETPATPPPDTVDEEEIEDGDDGEDEMDIELTNGDVPIEKENGTFLEETALGVSDEDDGLDDFEVVVVN